MSARLIGYLLGAILFLAYSAGLFYLGDQHCQSAQQAAVIKSQVKQDKAVEKVQQSQSQREIVYVDRLKVVHDAKDDCLDQSLPANLLSQIRASSP